MRKYAELSETPKIESVGRQSEEELQPTPAELTPADPASAEPISAENRPQEQLRFSFSVPERKRSLKRLEKFRYILDDPDYQKLKTIRRHNSTDTYKHSIRVAMIAAAMAERMGEDPDSAMKTGLLHDYCLLDYNLRGEEKRKAKKEANAGLFCFYHPKNAAENAKRFGLTDRELEAISTHMFPLGPMPKTKLGWIIRMADLEAGSEETFLGRKKKEK